MRKIITALIVISLLLVMTHTALAISPDIKANGSNGSFNIQQANNLSITVSLDPESSSGIDCDWWVAAATPFGWYYYNLSFGWIPGLSFTHQGPLIDMSPFVVLNISRLPIGTYTFYFGVDTNMNGVLDFNLLDYDSVIVNVLGLPNISLSTYAIHTESPSIVNIAIKARDKKTGEPYTALTTDDFNVLEDGGKVSIIDESFLDLQQMLPHTLYTVLMLDVSSSISLSNLNTIKEAAMAMIVNPNTGHTVIKPNNQIAIYAFDDSIKQVSGFTNNITQLLKAIDGIERGGPSTNLYGALIEGMNQWENVVTQKRIDFGSLIVITDGNDTAGLSTLTGVLSQQNEKQVYSIGIGSAVNWDILNQISHEHISYSINDYSQLLPVINKVKNDIDTFKHGLYFLSYASPKRTGFRTLEVSVIDNTNIDADSLVANYFSADGFSSVKPELTIKGPDGVGLSGGVELQAVTRWTNDPVTYIWDTDPPGVVNLVINPSDPSRATINSITKLPQDDVTIIVEETNFNLEARKDIKVGDIYLEQNTPLLSKKGPVTYIHERAEDVLVNGEILLDVKKGAIITNDRSFNIGVITVSTPGGIAPPNYKWTIPNSDIAKVEVLNAPSQSILLTGGLKGTTYLTIEDTENKRLRKVPISASGAKDLLLPDVALYGYFAPKEVAPLTIGPYVEQCTRNPTGSTIFSNTWGNRIFFIGKSSLIQAKLNKNNRTVTLIVDYGDYNIEVRGDNGDIVNTTITLDSEDGIELNLYCRCTQPSYNPCIK